MPAVMPLLVKLSPDAIVSVDPAVPTEPTVRAVIDEVVNKLRYAFAVAAAEENSHGTGRADQIFSEFLASRAPGSRSAYKQSAGRLLAASAPMRTTHFGRYATVDPQQYRTVGSDGIEKTVGRLPLDREAVQKDLTALTSRTLREIVPSAWKNVLKLPHTAPHGKPKLDGLPKPEPKHDPKPIFTGLPKPPDPDLKAGLAFKKMKLFITAVRCIEETDEVGSDEIAMGGSAVDTAGNTHMVGDFAVHDDFDAGEKKNFGFSKTFFTWDIATQPEGFPYVYCALIAMAEKDDGGFYKMLQKIWDIVSDEVKTLIAAGFGALIGSIVSGPFAGLGAVAGAAIGAFIGWLINLAENLDDFIGAKSVLMTLGSATKSYYEWAKLTSPQGWTKTIRFKGDGGIYDVDLAYRIFV